MRSIAALSVLLAMPCTVDADIQFATSTEYELSGSEPRRVIVANLDGDTNPDLIVAMSADGEVALRFGDGTGDLPEDGSVQTEMNAWALAVGDLDGDGFDDLINVILDWTTNGSGHGGDVDGSGIVDVDDLVAVILAWGRC